MAYTLKISADTSGFIKNLNKADSAISQTTKIATELQNSLDVKYDPSNLQNAQKLCQKALEKTNDEAKAIQSEMKKIEDAGRVDSDDYNVLSERLEKTKARSIELQAQMKSLGEVAEKQVAEKFEKVGDKLDTLSSKTKYFSAAAAAALAALAKIGLSAVETGDEISTLSVQYDMSTKEIQRWQYVALQSDVSEENLFKGVKKVKAAIADLSVGASSTGATALEALGIDPNSFSDADEAFSAIIAKLSAISDTTERDYYANQIFGDNIASNIIPLLEQGGAALDQYNSEFEAMGYLSEDQVKALSDFDNVLNNIKSQFAIAGAKLGTALLPLMQNFANIINTSIIPAIERFTTWFGNLSLNGQNTIITLLAVAAAVSPLLKLASSAITVIPKLITMISSLKATTLATAAGFAALFASAALIYNLINNWGNMSAVEKAFFAIAIAATAAAAAIMIFHASWSLGIAIGAIVAAIAVGAAAITAASKEFGIDESASANTGATADTAASTELPAASDYASAAAAAKTETNTAYNDNSTYNITVEVEKNEYVSEDDLIDTVAKKLAAKIQARS